MARRRHQSLTSRCMINPRVRWDQVELQRESNRVNRFILAFEKLYGRNPKPGDADGNFAAQVARDMEMRVGGARYYIRAATDGKSSWARPE